MNLFPKLFQNFQNFLLSCLVIVYISWIPFLSDCFDWEILTLSQRLSLRAGRTQIASLRGWLSTGDGRGMEILRGRSWKKVQFLHSTRKYNIIYKYIKCTKVIQSIPRLWLSIFFWKLQFGRCGISRLRVNPKSMWHKTTLLLIHDLE